MQDFIFLRVPGEYVRIDFNDIVYVEARKNFVQIVTRSTSYFVQLTMKRIQAILPEEQFCRIHRSFIVAYRHVKSFDCQTARIQNPAKHHIAELPIGEHFLETLKSRVNIVERPSKALSMTNSLELEKVGE